jgi:hypothetical protein
MSIKTQGTELFFVDSLSSSVASVAKMACPTGITGLGGPADQIETTCLDNLEDRTYDRGLGNPGQVTVPFVFKPWEVSQQTLWDLKDSGDTIGWMVGMSDGTNPPTLDSNDELVGPASRTSLGFQGYVADLNIDIATNEVVRGTMLIQRSGGIERFFNGPTP